MLYGCVTEEVVNSASTLLFISHLAVKTLFVHRSCFGSFSHHRSLLLW